MLKYNSPDLTKMLLNLKLLQGEDSVEYYIGLTPSGIVVLRDKITVAYYYWPRITKVYFKGRYFMLRVSDKNVRLKMIYLKFKFIHFFYYCVFFYYYLISIYQ